MCFGMKCCCCWELESKGPELKSYSDRCLDLFSAVPSHAFKSCK